MTDLAGGMASEGLDGSDASPASEPPRPSRTRLIIALTLFAFVGGLVAMAWLMAHWQGGLRFGKVDPATIAASANATGNSIDSDDPTLDMPASGASARGPAMVLTGDQQEARVVDLEQRLAHVSVAAQSASAYANRAEAMMIAFAARRSLDAGAPLGYVEGQLRLIFGDAQPRAVATIINAAVEPVTLGMLRAGLEKVGTAVERGSPDEGWWAGAMREMRGLAVVRHAGAPSPEPRQRLARARLGIETGQIEAAMNEIARLPQRPETAQWLEQARRYNEAHRALDVIEAASILEPRTAPLVAPAPAQPAPQTVPSPRP